MADKPSRALVLYGDGLARFVDPTHAHLHSLASKANCGFLSLPHAPPAESEDERAVREFACVLDEAEAYVKVGKVEANVASCQGSSDVPSLSERFMGMKVALVTNNMRLKAFGHQLGLSLINLDGFCKSGQSYLEQCVDDIVLELLKLLGFQDGKALEMSQFDLVLMHVGAGDSMDGNLKNASAHNLRFIDSVVGSLLQVAQPGTEISLRLHLSLVLSYGSVFDPIDYSISSEEERDPRFSKLFPRQSYTMKGEQPRNDVRHHCPMLIAQWQYAVTRKDRVKTFSFKDIKKNGGNLVIPADRFLHEVAFKLWKAPKYGA